MSIEADRVGEQLSLIELAREELPMPEAFQVADSLPNDGPMAVENSAESRVRMCDAILDGLKVGGYRPEGAALEGLEKTISMARELNRMPNWVQSHESEENLTIKQKVQLRKRGEKRKKVETVMDVVGVDLKEIDEDELLMVREFAEAIYHTHQYLEAVNPGDVVHRRSVDEGMVRLGARANYEWGDFFLKVAQRFELSDEEVHGLFQDIFQREDVKTPFRAKGAEHFMVGIWALVNAYLLLRNGKHEGGYFQVGSVEQDMYDGVDLEWSDGEDEGEREVYEVKSISRKKLPIQPVLLNVSSGKSRKMYGKILEGYHGSSEVDRRIRSFDKLADFVQRRKENSNKINGFVVVVPV